MKKLKWRWLKTWSDEFDFNIEDYISPCIPATSDWWKGLPRFLTSATKNIKDFVNERHRKYLYDAQDREPFKVKTFNNGLEKTAKECPGIMSVFKTSYLIKCPSDMMITISKSMDIVVDVPAGSNFKVESHHFAQIASQNNLFEGRINIKFVLPIMLCSESKIPWVFFNPTYHSNPIWDVIPGVIDENYTQGIELNVNTLIDTRTLEWDAYGTYTINLKKGDPIAYLWLPEKTKFVYDDKFKGHNKDRY